MDVRKDVNEEQRKKHQQFELVASSVIAFSTAGIFVYLLLSKI